MIGLVLALQAAVPSAPPPAPPVETLPVAAAGLATRIVFDGEGAITGCSTEVQGMQGPIDGCLLFAKPALLARLLGRSTAGLAWVAVRLDGRPEGAAAAPSAGADRRLLAAADATIAPDGSVARCDPAPAMTSSLDLCALMPKGGALFTPQPGSTAGRVMRVEFAVESGAR